ncbi:SIR2 family protein [Pantoea ananatis]|uniref:SIR2 family protein n=1 Tax=Pantoea ananas TaxID=553 RepID=UPI0002E1F564|nr:SIR2 family protein [Pantoea ananatis]
MNYSIPNQLKKAIEQKKLLIFLGAGISARLGLPLWKEIVAKTLENPDIHKGLDYKKALENDLFTPLEVLDKIKEQNKKTIYQTFERETHSDKKDVIYTKLMKISKKFITTNYDQLLEANTGIDKIDNTSTFNLQKIDEKDSFILKIHGCRSAIDNAVIFSSDYESLYNSSSPLGGLSKFQLTKLISSHSCLFIGYSLNDHFLVKLFDTLEQMYEGIGKEHYIISTKEIEHKFVDNIRIYDTSHLDTFLDVLIKESLSTHDSINTIAKTETNVREIIHQQEEEFHLTVGKDTPPIIEKWAGRVAEMDALRFRNKACFITGIGGQGKSSLASKFLSETNDGSFDFREWRDFKEEELNFQTKLYSLIELVSHKKRLISELVGLETEYLIEVFFKELGQQKGIFVFDNIDRYIDLQTFTPSGEMGKFFDFVVNVHHNSKFIFTCRPFIHMAKVGTYQIRLEGLQELEIQDLISKYHHKISSQELENLAKRLFINTQGHPLWMTLILAQSRIDFSKFDQVLSKIERRELPIDDSNFSTIVSTTVLDNLWENLKEKEKIVLRTLSICNIAEAHDELSKIVERKLNYNQFSKAVRTLKSLNLIVEKEGEGYLELHPLVREFIKGKYDEKDQESYIALYVSYLNRIILLLKNKFGKVLPSDEIEVILKKIEVLVVANKFQDAIDEIRLTGDSILISGYCEDFIRLSDLLLDKITWNQKSLKSFVGFNDFLDTFFTRAVQFGRFDLFDKYSEKYSQIYKSADANLILIKSSLCNRFWIEGKIDLAIQYGKSASDLIDFLGEKDTWHGKHRYHLALRDSLQKENIEKAIGFFCEGRDLEYIINGEIETYLYSHYGNIGKCYDILEEDETALRLICKACIAIRKGTNSYHDLHNLGYAAKWIYEILSKKSERNLEIYFLVFARNLWKNDMPSEANKLNLLILNLPSSVLSQSIVNLESWQIEKHCNEWVEKFMR